MNTILKHWNRLKRSLKRQWHEFRLPQGYIRLGTKYGGWWIDKNKVAVPALLIDCGLGEDISFPAAFLQLFSGRVIGIEPNPRSLEYCREHVPDRMTIIPKAFWKEAGQNIVFHLPRPQEQLPKGADGISGSILASHEYVSGGAQLRIVTTDLFEILDSVGRQSCDILKIDIEGAEYEVLNDLANKNALSRVGQLLVEFHHGVTHHTFEETEETSRRIMNAGFDLIHVEGRNYIFKRIT